MSIDKLSVIEYWFKGKQHKFIPIEKANTAIRDMRKNSVNKILEGIEELWSSNDYKPVTWNTMCDYLNIDHSVPIEVLR